jgi:DNA-binding PadR family transcriptional regulator
MLSLGKTSGYDIKQLVDKSTRHFWAASYGQIYPELRRLQEQGLIEGRDEPSGGRPRTVYVLTDAGRAALRSWLEHEDGGPVFEFRCETMLKLFFSDAAAPEPRVHDLDAFRQQLEAQLAQFREMEPHAAQGPEGPYLCLQFGIAHTQFLIDWCRQTAQRLSPARSAEE